MRPLNYSTLERIEFDNQQLGKNQLVEGQFYSTTIILPATTLDFAIVIDVRHQLKLPSEFKKFIKSAEPGRQAHTQP